MFVEVVSQNFALLFTFLICHSIISLMDEIVVCVTVVGIRVSADMHTPFLSNEVIHKAHLRLQYFTEAFLCHSYLQSIKLRREVKCLK